jgi:hypothetical protein
MSGLTFALTWCSMITPIQWRIKGCPAAPPPALNNTQTNCLSALMVAMSRQNAPSRLPFPPPKRQRQQPHDVLFFRDYGQRQVLWLRFIIIRRLRSSHYESTLVDRKGGSTFTSSATWYIRLRENGYHRSSSRRGCRVVRCGYVDPFLVVPRRQPRHSNLRKQPRMQQSVLLGTRM